MPTSSRDWERLRTTFEEVPELYDRARPSYPPQLFDDFVKLARLGEAARIVEIGCGTGKATAPLATRGYRITCVELGEQLAALARRNLAAFRNVDVVTAAFETWQPSASGFDAIVAFSAFHWIDPELRYTKPASLLRPGGALAVVDTSHVLPDDGDEFFADVQEDYVALTASDDSRPPRPEDVADRAGEIEASGLFGAAGARRYVWDVTYTADEYIAVLDTYSGHRALAPEVRAQLYERIRRRIESRPRRTLRKTYLTTLTVATRP